MNLVGTPQCPHLGFGATDGRPCCHADDATRLACGRWAPNPLARSAGAQANITGQDAFFCTVLGKENIPAEALRLAAQEKARQAQGQAPTPKGYRPPDFVTGQKQARPVREQPEDIDQPVIPTEILRRESARVGPNQPCPCGSGRKFKKCCGKGA